MTRLVVLQPGYLPWLGFFDQLQKADVFVHYDDVQYDKHGWRNRNRVKSAKGSIWLTVPVLHSGRFGQQINEVKIDDGQHWRKKHLASIAQAYAQAPFLQATFAPLRDIIEQPWSHLVDLDLAIIKWIARELKILTPCFRSSDLDIQGGRDERLVDLCRHFKATRYLSGSAAREYLQVEKFTAEGIAVEWHDYRHPVYPQLYGDFVPYLSTLDLMMNVGPGDRVAFLCAGESALRAE
jgi:hypothetical protein